MVRCIPIRGEWGAVVALATSRWCERSSSSAKLQAELDPEEGHMVVVVSTVVAVAVAARVDPVLGHPGG